MHRLLFTIAMVIAASRFGLAQATNSAVHYQLQDFDDALGYGDGSSEWSDKDGELSVVGMDLRQLVAFAYGLPASRVSPDLRNLDARFLIKVHIPRAPGEMPAERARHLMEVLQDLLAEKEGLQAHVTDLTEHVLVMRVAKEGLKMRRGGQGVSTEFVEVGGPDGGHVIHKHVQARGVGLAFLAETLTVDAGEAVIDRTNLTGPFRFDLRWQAHLDGSADTGAMIKAARQQLGIELVTETQPVQRVVVDSFRHKVLPQS